MPKSSAELELEAAAARDKLAATLDDLRFNLAPGRLFDEVLGKVGGTDSVSLFRRFEAGIRSYPVPSMLVGIGSALFLGSNWTAKPNASEDIEGQASLNFGDLDQKSMRDNVASVGHTVTDTAYHTLKLRAAQKLEDVTVAATAGIGAASDHVLGVAEAAIDKAAAKVSAKVEQRPLAFSVIAIALGAAVGAALLRTTNGKGKLMALADALKRLAGAATGPDAPTQPFVVTISHALGRREAVRRIETGLGEVSRALAENRMVLAEHRWSGDSGEFTVRALGQSFTAFVEVMDDVVRIEARLPWMLAAFAERARGAIQSGGTKLLEKK